MARSVTSARRPLETVGDDRWLVLERGQRNDIDDKTGDRTLSSFETTACWCANVRCAKPRHAAQGPATLDLLREPTPRNQGELAWRFGMLLATANLLLLGLGLAATNPRRPSNWNLLFALLAFVVYFNLINLSQAWVAAAAGPGHGAAGRCTAAPSGWRWLLLWWRDHAAVLRLWCRDGGDGMKTVRRLFYRDILSSVGFVGVAFLSLFFFIDFVDDLDAIGRRGRAVWHVALAALYEVPGHFYELLPIAVLIGTIYSLARMAQASEFTILRTGGLGPGRALGLLAVAGRGLRALNFVVGDYVAPRPSGRQAVLLAARFDGARAMAAPAPG
jgi:lipopolysaccharide export LptBFGC system permease protein LptF